MTAVTALALLISKVLDKARELSAKFFEKEAVQMIAEPNVERAAPIILQTDKTQKQEKITHKEPTDDLSTQQRTLQPETQTAEPKAPQIPPKPVMSAEAAAYPKLLKIYRELNRQNGIIFAAAKTANADYRDKADNWEKIYGMKAKNDTMQEKIQNLQRRICQQKEQMPQRKNRGAR